MSDEMTPRDPEYRGNGGGTPPVEWAAPQTGRPESAEYVWVGQPREVDPESARRRRIYLHTSLFILTILSTWFRQGPVYSAAIVGILLAHEMGHYLMCRHYGVEATLPFFIPMPLHFFGTMGAVIRMRGPIPSRRVLFDIAAAGPIAGLVLAIPAVIIGLQHSAIIPTPPDGSGFFSLGDSPLFSFLADRILGPIPDGKDVSLGPLAFAGWAGLFVTALNLLPVGQLDGGHIVYGLVGPRSRWVSMGVCAALAAVSIFMYPGWWLLLALLLFFGFRHPAPMDDQTRLGLGRILIGVIMLVFFAISFTPIPGKL